MTPNRKIICHAEGDRCHGCAHYRGTADVCIYAKPADQGPAQTVETDAKAIVKYLRQALRCNCYLADLGGIECNNCKVRRDVRTLETERDEAKAERNAAVKRAIDNHHAGEANRFAEYEKRIAAEAELAAVKARLSVADGKVAHYQGEFEHVVSKYDSALAQLADARKDGERLDFVLKLIEDKGTDGIRDLDWTAQLDPITREPEHWIFDRAAIDSAKGAQ